MGRKIIDEEMFPEIVKQYNSGGRTAAYDYLRSSYGIKQPYFVIRRIQKSDGYTYDPDTDRFLEQDKSESDSVFMDLEELCSHSVVATERPTACTTDTRSATMEKLVHELISDRLLALSRYVTMDSSTRTILIDRTSLIEDGYHVVTH